MGFVSSGVCALLGLRGAIWVYSRCNQSMLHECSRKSRCRSWDSAAATATASSPTCRRSALTRFIGSTSRSSRTPQVLKAVVHTQFCRSRNPLGYAWFANCTCGTAIGASNLGTVDPRSGSSSTTDLSIEGPVALEAAVSYRNLCGCSRRCHRANYCLR